MNVEGSHASQSVKEEDLLGPDDEEDAYQSLKHLRDDLLQLSEINRDLAELTKEQAGQVKKVGKNIDSVAHATRKGTVTLQQAAKYKGYMYPVAGALIGCVAGGVIGGPIGAVVGIKAASGIAGGLVTGVFAGYFLGKAVQKTTKQTTSVELEKLDGKKEK